MKYRVAFDPRAEADLQQIYLYLADLAGHRIASAYVNQIIDYCQEFETFPERGRRLDHMRPGLRTVGFKRKATIAFLVRADSVTILRIFNHGRNAVLDDGNEPPPG
jgi:toxin ParE1/3/4